MTDLDILVVCALRVICDSLHYFYLTMKHWHGAIKTDLQSGALGLGERVKYVGVVGREDEDYGTLAEKLGAGLEGVCAAATILLSRMGVHAKMTSASQVTRGHREGQH